jgi:demethylmenaquinone methyltransferase/2-methoxy-6-polyprenyl-1,4-benzoquinol methylase
MTAKSGLARKIFGGLSPSYDSVLNRMTLYQDGIWKRRMLEKLPLGKQTWVLDVGCGTCVLEERFPMKGSQVVGIDITSGMVRLAQQKGLASAPVLGLADGEHLPFRAESFDVALSCYVPKYCDTRRLVKDLGRVLKPGGRLAVYDFTRPQGPLSPLLKYYELGFIPALGKLVAPLDRSVAFTFGALPGLIMSTSWSEEFRSALEENDFSDVEREALTGGVVTLFWATKR